MIKKMSACMSAAHHFGIERRVSDAHENDERVNALFVSLTLNSNLLTVFGENKSKLNSILNKSSHCCSSSSLLVNSILHLLDTRHDTIHVVLLYY